ncbi:MAG: CBS domain-containing protein [Eubacteriales bacterium]
MNVAFFLIPKAQVKYLYDNFTIRQALEKMRMHGYTAIPVLNDEGQYMGTVSEGDFLWHIIGNKGECENTDMKSLEKELLKHVLVKEKNPPVNITTSVEDLLNQSLRQNFVSVVDDKGSFIGIVTRQDIIRYFVEHKN